MPLRHIGETKVQLQSFSTSVLTVVNGQFHAPADLSLWREQWYSLNMRPGGPQNWSGRLEKIQISCPWQSCKHQIQTPDPPNRSLVAISTTLYRLLHSSSWDAKYFRRQLKISAFYGNRRLITVLATAGQLSLSTTKWIWFTPAQGIFLYDQFDITIPIMSRWCKWSLPFRLISFLQRVPHTQSISSLSIWPP